MAPLPNAGRAILDIRKLEDYCLSPVHPRGRHKARVFREAIALTRQDAGWLRDTLLDALSDVDAIELRRSSFGTQFRVDVPVTRHGQSVVIRTVWTIQTNETPPRFLTCWVL